MIDLKKILKEELMFIMEIEDSQNKEAQNCQFTSKLATENKITNELNESLQEELSNLKEQEIQGRKWILSMEYFTIKRY